MTGMILMFMWIYCIINFSSLPQNIVTHFDFNGNPDDYGSKNTIWILPGIATLLIIIFNILGKRPDRFNYIAKIDETNAAFQYRSALRMLSILGLNISVLFCYIQFKVISGAQKHHAELDIWVIPILLVSLLTPAFYFVYSTSKKNK